ncbi:MAG: hypothetical protein R2838_16435 [Caldilineaceae bacterium]
MAAKNRLLGSWTPAASSWATAPWAPCSRAWGLTDGEAPGTLERHPARTRSAPSTGLCRRRRHGHHHQPSAAVARLKFRNIGDQVYETDKTSVGLAATCVADRTSALVAEAISAPAAN